MEVKEYPCSRYLPLDDFDGRQRVVLHAKGGYRTIDARTKRSWRIGVVSSSLGCDTVIRPLPPQRGVRGAMPRMVTVSRYRAYGIGQHQNTISTRHRWCLQLHPSLVT